LRARCIWTGTRLPSSGSRVVSCPKDGAIGAQVAGEFPSSNGSGYALLNALDRFRDDVREDLGALEGRLMVAIADNRRALGDYSTTHKGVHDAERLETQAAFAESKVAYARFEAYIESSKISQARRDGALGVVRYILELVGTNGGGLLRLGIGLAGVLLALSGNVHIDLGAR
jgi:hypothetical protein